MVSRRDVIKGITATVGLAGIGSSPLAGELWPDSGLGFCPKSNPIDPGLMPTKRVIFFLQNHGFDQASCLPADVQESCALDSLTLAEPMADLEPYKDRMHVVTGLHGRHTSPMHSPYFGALGGYRGGAGVAPSAATVDYLLGHHVPPAILPHLAIGMNTLNNMEARPALAALSASGPQQPLLMYSNPNMLYEMLFGSVAEGTMKANYEARSEMLRTTGGLAAGKAKGLPTADRKRYGTYLDGYADMIALRDKLADKPDLLTKYAPTVDERYLNPTFETDWHDVLLDIGIAALQAQVTNVLTIASGSGGIDGSWHGLGIVQQGHGLGHTKFAEDGRWTKIRKYNCRMLIKLMQALEAIPEGDGTMMDHTLIIYGSNNGASQHTDGSNWPFVFLGNGGGVFTTGRHTRVDDRPINDLYATLLRGVGVPADHFNLSPLMVHMTGSQAGPIEALLA